MNHKCIMPFCHVEIHKTGEVYTCCPAYIKSSIGNIYENNFDEIWNSKEAKMIRNNILNNNYSNCDLTVCSKENSMPYQQIEYIYEKIELNDNVKYPKIVKFCHDAECNYKCITCRKEVMANDKDTLDYLDSKIEDIFIPLLKNAEIACFSGDGDPFASRHYRKLIKSVVSEYPNIKIDLHTNGSLCNEENCIELNILDKLSCVQISMHATNENTYKKITNSNKFNTVLENIKWLQELKQNRLLNEIHLIFVVSKLNYKEMPEFVELAKSFDARAYFWECRDWGVLDEEGYDNLTIFDKNNKDFLEFKKVLDSIVEDSNCNLSPFLKECKEI